MDFGKQTHDCIRDLLVMINRYKKLATVRKAKIELKKKVDELNKCKHCDEGEPAYCEKCFQELITKNMDLQIKNIELGKHTIPKITTYNPYMTSGTMMFGMEGPDEPEEIWIKPKNESEVKCDGDNE